MTNRCEHAGENHSRDRVAVYHGTVKPMILCGYHASQLAAEFYERQEVIG
jgi:formylmethanofuran dehydrogenase subunit E